jgi:hypothetical protein
MNKLVIESAVILGLAFLGASCIMAVGAQNAASRPSMAPPVVISKPLLFTPTPVVPADPTLVAVVVPPTDVPVPTEIPAAAPEPTAVPPVEPTAVPPATYELVNMEDVTAAGRQRFRVAIVMSADYSDDQLKRVFRDATNRAYQERPQAKALVVFGHSSRAEVGKGADLGNAWSSSDGRGWAGDGKLESLADDGKIVLNIGSAFTVRPRSQVVMERGVEPQPATVAPKPVAPAAPKPAAPAKPAPGSAIVCNDGSTWPSMTRQGACSRRGGIAPGY